MIQQITDGSNTCFAQKCSSMTAVTAVTDEHFCAKHVFDPSVICCIIDFYFKLSPY